MEIPASVSLEGLEKKWQEVWEAAGVYRFDSSAPKEAVYSIDTPPPTVSGSLHIGHIFSYTHADIVARYHRMQGCEVFFPLGWDDNGVPTERRVQNYFGVRCDPSLSYQEDLALPEAGKIQIPVSRRNFIELCDQLTALDEAAFEELWRKVGLSVDWSRTYTTVGSRARKVSQAAFLRLAAAGHIYQSDSPTLWDVDFQTAVSQAELEDREIEGRYHRIRFQLEQGGEVVIESSRPELLPACVALVCHPADQRYREVVGTLAITPLFSVPVPVIAHPLADPEKGTGIAMVCTFGDLTDVIWWREANLPLRLILDRNGRITDDASVVTRVSRTPSDAAESYARLAGKRAAGAREEIAKMLFAAGALVGEARPVVHPVKFYEKGDRPLEVVASRQWFIRLLTLKERLIARGRELDWLPPHMRVRYEDWVTGLNSDWNISRQRYFGIPVPVWYPVDGSGSVRYEQPIFASEADLPVDPLAEAPPGYNEVQRDQPGGFAADRDVMDTWATSSLTPQLAGGWLEDDNLFAKVFPMDLRPQGQDIIRTWLFYTVVRSELGFSALPWRSAMISGFVLDPDRKKMSKSRGNVVTPMPLLERFGADALRYWAAGGRSGVDSATDEGRMKVGRRLAIKIGNATRFVLTIVASESDGGEPSLVPLDLAMLAELDASMEEATAALQAHDYTRALETVEGFFWRFCDDYLELVKMRAYGNQDGLAGATPQGTASARAALAIGIEVLLRALAPFLPFITEEAWSWWMPGSVHRAAWPQAGEAARRYLEATGSAETSPGQHFQVASELLATIRKAKSEAKLSMKAPLSELLVAGDVALLRIASEVLNDLAAAGVVESFRLDEGERAVVATL